MSIIFRKRLRFGPFVVNAGKRGFTSWGLKVGPWSWNSRTRAQRIDLPGPFSWTSKGSSTTRFVRVMIGLGVVGIGTLATLILYVASRLGL